jgi:hypothetical protein
VCTPGGWAMGSQNSGTNERASRQSLISVEMKQNQISIIAVIEIIRSLPDCEDSSLSCCSAA